MIKKKNFLFLKKFIASVLVTIILFSTFGLSVLANELNSEKNINGDDNQAIENSVNLKEKAETENLAGTESKKIVGNQEEIPSVGTSVNKANEAETEKESTNNANN